MSENRSDRVRRRGMLAGFAALGTLLAGKASRAQAAEKDATKVAYHLCDLDKVSFVLGNIQNHLNGVGGPDNVSITLVVHGPALKGFHAATASPDTIGRVHAFAKAGVALHACGNTMRAQNVTVNELAPGFSVAERGGVVLLAELQAQGFVYLKP